MLHVVVTHSDLDAVLSLLVPDAASVASNDLSSLMSDDMYDFSSALPVWIFPTTAMVIYHGNATPRESNPGLSLCYAPNRD